VNAEELKQAGEELFGKKWKAPLARKLGVHSTTIWRYLQANKVPNPEAMAIRLLLNEKRK